MARGLRWWSSAVLVLVVAVGTSACKSSNSTPNTSKFTPLQFDGRDTTVRRAADAVSDRLHSFYVAVRNTKGRTEASRTAVAGEKHPCTGSSCPSTPVMTVRTGQPLSAPLARILTTPGYLSVRVLESDAAAGCKDRGAPKGYDWTDPFPAVPLASIPGCFRLGPQVLSFVAGSGFSGNVVLVSARKKVERQALLDFARENRTRSVALVLDGWVLQTYRLSDIDGLAGKPPARPLGDFEVAMESSEAAAALAAVVSQPPLPVFFEPVATGSGA